MTDVDELLVAIIAGVVQGVLDWLPVSSSGNLAIVLALLGIEPAMALQLAIFLQLGTTLAAALYYRDDVAAAFAALPAWRPWTAFQGINAVSTFVVGASLVTGLVGIPLYLLAVDLASELAGGLFVALIGVLLVLTGVVQLVAESVDLAEKVAPTPVDTIAVGALQGLAILPGVSRSGVTVSMLLFARHTPSSALRLSFLLSIPAGIGAAGLILVGAGGLPGVSPASALTALAISAVVGYLVIGTLMAIVERVPFAAVCFGLGAIAIAGGLVLWLW